MPRLAIMGGPKVRERLFPAYRVIGREEEQAAVEVIRSGVLSRFLGCWHDDFYGGPEVRKLEAEWAEYYGVKHAISVNSATSGLYCAVGACGAGPGDEIIVCPYTMSASAAAALVYNAVPVFADIEPDFFCLDVKSIEQRITSRTRAIIVVDIFGQPYDAEAINALAARHGLKVIEDAAQAPGAIYHGRPAGTLGDMGVFSLNYHKHIHTGEGGIVVTNDDDLADRLRLIRNHAETVVEDMGFSSLVNMLGFNYRMNEIEAAMAGQQLRKLGGLLQARRENVKYLESRLQGLECLEIPPERPGCEHAYYVHALKYRSASSGLSRSRYVEAVAAELAPIELREGEGVNIGAGYVAPLYLEPLYQQRILYGGKSCPFGCPWYEGQVDYSRGICPVTERMHFDELITHEMIRPPMTREDLDDVAQAFWKVWEHRAELGGQTP